MTYYEVHTNGEPEAGPFDSQKEAAQYVEAHRHELPDATWTVEKVDTGEQAMTPEEARGHVVTGLVANYADLYRSSPSFNNGVNAIANLLPAWVDGLAVHAERMDAQLAAIARQHLQAGNGGHR